MKIKVSGVTKSIKKRTILDHVQLEVEGIYGLIGPNGAGKTTLMKILASMQSLDSGSVELDAEEFVQKKYVKKNSFIGYLSQDFMVYPQISVYEVLNHIAVLQGIKTKRERQQAILESIQMVNLNGHEHKKMSELSGGMRRRVGIAQLLMRKPTVLLFDEPTAGLDIEERIRFRNLLKNLGQHHTVVISSHIVEDIEFLCTKIGILKEGVVHFEGTPEELKKQAEGLIYEQLVQPEELDNLLLNKEVVQITEEQEGLSVRVFSIEKEEANIVAPRLIDGYLTVVRGDKYATT